MVSDGIVRNHKRIRERKIKTLFGTINIERIGYSTPGNNSLFPKDSMLNLSKFAYSFSLQKLVVQEAIRGSFEEGIESIERTVGIKIPKRQAEEIILVASSYFYSFYEQHEYKPYTNNLSLLVLTLDGKGIAMR
ncbi:ISKra4 family transposase, partial [Candidatus Babeliales bacterium]|nr:ISKra4 family transposase [Candidatus Babeliales bacterium]